MTYHVQALSNKEHLLECDYHIFACVHVSGYSAWEVAAGSGPSLNRSSHGGEGGGGG